MCVKWVARNFVGSVMYHWHLGNQRSLSKELRLQSLTDHNDYRIQQYQVSIPNHHFLPRCLRRTYPAAAHPRWFVNSISSTHLVDPLVFFVLKCKSEYVWCAGLLRVHGFNHE